MQSIQTLATSLASQLKQRNWKLATAESCTGGGIAYFLTGIPGSSEWLDRGFVTYSNAAKSDMLGVSTITLKNFGAVSAETAREMAAGALQHSQAQLVIAVTGIAGPGGGTTDKPVGTIWLAWGSIANAMHTAHYHFTGNRETIRTQTIQAALHHLVAFCV